MSLRAFTLSVLTALTTLCLTALSIASIASDEHEPLANPHATRISAKPLADGRIEFAVQLAESSCDEDTNTMDTMETEDCERTETSWGKRVLPQVRKFPAKPTTERWYSSSPPILIGEVETRIRARRLADGRTEFALQQKADGISWGEHILPSGRYISAAHQKSHIDRWLNSTPAQLARKVVAPDGVPIVAEGVLARSDLDGYSWTSAEPSFYYGAQQDPLDDTYDTWVVMVAKTDDDLYDTMRIQVSCYGGKFEVAFWEDGLPYQSDDRYVRVSYRFDDDDAESGSWNHYEGSNDGFYPPNAAAFADKLRSADQFVIRASFYSRTLTATFTGVHRLFRTPVQPNLTYCGRY